MKKIIILLAVLYSCGQSKQIEKELSLLYSYPIKIPINLTTTFNGRDSIIEEFFCSRLKLIIYTNSSECSSCNIKKMLLWEPYINYANNNDIDLFFIFQATKINIFDIKLSLSSYPLDYPMLIDKNGDFEKMNPHLPKNKAMHTFLLDENNKVILVGNPLHNKEIEKLFYKKTQELLAK